MGTIGQKIDHGVETSETLETSPATMISNAATLFDDPSAYLFFMSCVVAGDSNADEGQVQFSYDGQALSPQHSLESPVGDSTAPLRGLLSAQAYLDSTLLGNNGVSYRITADAGDTIYADQSTVMWLKWTDQGGGSGGGLRTGSFQRANITGNTTHTTTMATHEDMDCRPDPAASSNNRAIEAQNGDRLLLIASWFLDHNAFNKNSECQIDFDGTIEAFCSVEGETAGYSWQAIGTVVTADGTSQIAAMQVRDDTGGGSANLTHSQSELWCFNLDRAFREAFVAQQAGPITPATAANSLLLSTPPTDFTPLSDEDYMFLAFFTWDKGDVAAYFQQLEVGWYDGSTFTPVGLDMAEIGTNHDSTDEIPIFLMGMTSGAPAASGDSLQIRYQASAAQGSINDVTIVAFPMESALGPPVKRRQLTTVRM